MRTTPQHTPLWNRRTLPTLSDQYFQAMVVTIVALIGVSWAFRPPPPTYA